MRLLNSLDSHRRAAAFAVAKSRYANVPHNVHAYATNAPCGIQSPQGFHCCGYDGVNRLTPDRKTCCSQYGPVKCPDGSRTCGGEVCTDPLSLINPLSPVNQQPAEQVAKKQQIGPSFPTSAPSGGGTCSLPPQDQDCCNYGSAGGLFDWACVAGKSLTKGGSNLTNLFGRLGGPCIPGVGIPCWIIVVVGIAAVVGYSFLRRR